MGAATTAGAHTAEVTELLQQLKGAGVVPGAHGSYRYNEGYVLVQMDGVDEGLELPVEVAAHIFLIDDQA